MEELYPHRCIPNAGDRFEFECGASISGFRRWFGKLPNVTT